MDEIINPYIAGAPVIEQRMFFGREDVFSWIERSLSGQYADHILVVHGQRRVGKTSVLKQLPNRLPKRYVPVFFDLQGRTHTTLDRFLWWLAREIVRVLKQDRGISITPPERDLFTQDIEYFETRFLPELQPALGDDGILLLTFDEFDNLEESEVKKILAQPLIDYLRRMMGNPNVNFVFSIGSSGRKLENMQANYTEFFKTALYRKVSFLTKDDAHRLITMPVQGTIEYDKDAIQHIYEIVSGHPYFTQLICHELFSLCQKTGSRRIALKDVEFVLDDVVERGTVNLKFVWDEAVDLEKWSLACLAQLEGKRDTRAVTDYLTRQRVRFNQQALDFALLHLREKDVLTDDHRFVNQLLQIWLKKNRPIEQVHEELTEVNPIANRYIEIGLEFKNGRQYQKAIDSFQEALDIDADNLQAQINLALTYLDQKNIEKAIFEFEKALTIDEEDIVSRGGLCDAYLVQGDQARERGRPREAVLAYQKVLDINAEHTEARGRMSEINRQRAEKALDDGRDEEALNAFAEALKFTPEDPALIARVEKVTAEKKAKVLAAQVARSEKETNAGNWDKAVAALNEALAVSPGDESILERIASTKERQKKERLDTILAKVDQAEKTNRWDVAIAALNEYLLLQPDDAAIQKRLTDLIAAKRAAWLSAITTRADQAASYQNWDDALAVLNEVLALEPDNLEMKTRVAGILATRRIAELNAMLKHVEHSVQAARWDEAIDILNGGLGSDLDNEALLAKLAEVRKAKREARHKAALRLADMAAQAGKWSTAIEALNEVLANEPDNAEFQKKLAEVKRLEHESKLASLRMQARSSAKAEKFEEALASWKEYLSLEPDDREKTLVEIESVKKVHGLARAYDEAYKAYSRKNYEKAISLFKGIVVEDADYKEATSLLAESIELRRSTRKWWQSKWLWGGIGSVALLAAAWFVLRPGSPLMSALLTSTAVPTLTNTPVISATDESFATEIPILLPTVMPTPLPLAWTRLNSGQFLSKDQVTAIVVDPTDPGVMYVGTENASIYKSIDGGLSWQPAHNGLDATRINSLIMDPSNPNTLFAGVLLDDVYKSTDGGEHWQKASITSPSSSISQVVMDPNDSLHLLYLSDQIHESMDGGQTWQPRLVSGCPQDIQNLVFNPADDLILYASDGGGSSCAAGVYKSSDGGKVWSLIGLEGEEVSSGALQIDKQTGNILYASVKNTPKFYSSKDGGETWEQHLNIGCLVMAIHPTDSETVYCTSLDQLHKTTDGGKTWHQIMTHGGSDNIAALAFSPRNPDVLYIGRKGLFTLTDGGATSAEISNGLGNNPISVSMNAVQNANLYALDGSCVRRGEGDFYVNLLIVSSDGGKTWDEITDTPCNSALDADGVTSYWINRETAYRSKNGWGNPQQISQAGWNVFSIAANPHRANSLLVAFHSDNPGEGNIALSADGGATWESVSKVNWWDSPAQFIFDHNSGQVIHAVPQEGNIYRSEDGGKTWGTCGQPSVQSYGKDSPLAMDSNDDSRVYLATQGNGVFISADGCQTWQPSGLGDLYVNAIVVDFSNPNILYAATDSGAYISFDGGQSWGQVNDGLLGATVVYSIAVDKESNVYAATPYGIFKLGGK
jgi:tetratricopeptide (TPR) repeat protein/photosystem II stability/assembly factor-like uncharacterized protein